MYTVDISIECICFRHKMARRGVHPREAHHLRGCGRSPRLRQAAVSSDQNTLNIFSHGPIGANQDA